MNENNCITIPGRIKEAIGKTFHRLTVIEFDKRIIRNSRGYRYFVKCLCSCGNVTSVNIDDLKSKRPIKSCGCLDREVLLARLTTHGQSIGSVTKEYRSWCGMIGRCYNEANQKWNRYGGRGIIVCERWRLSFENFYADMGPVPSSRHSIDRIDNDGNYEPGNCHWATPRVQAVNRRSTINILYNGEKMCAMDVCKKIGIPAKRFYKWKLLHGADGALARIRRLVPGGDSVISFPFEALER